ncbi:hypothetical protein E2562_017702 [Oryza meyeriana var. granulata]|uniref:Uncharacterized protein n=1 Tax=Oryza meyeriana var. granulata TaxID=110450 RepID=A0A6G1BYF3_9ORYZ|nr:hypothetical protein E2562_017702 [Oryza meyeriana var. granulata]
MKACTNVVLIVILASCYAIYAAFGKAVCAAALPAAPVCVVFSSIIIKQPTEKDRSFLRLPKSLDPVQSFSSPSAMATAEIRLLLPELCRSLSRAGAATMVAWWSGGGLMATWCTVVVEAMAIFSSRR